MVLGDHKKNCTCERKIKKSSNFWTVHVLKYFGIVEDITAKTYENYCISWVTQFSVCVNIYRA